MTSGPITADAATNKVVGVKKSFTVTASAANKVTGLSKAEKKVVKVTKKGKKFTIKGLKAGKATFKIGKKSYIVKVGATAVKAAKAKVTLTAGKSAAVKFTATAGNGDTVAFTTSNKKVATLSKTSAKVSKNAAYVRVTAKAAGTAKVTATSKITGKKATVKVTVKNATPVTTATPVATGGATAAPDVVTGGTITVTTNATGAAVTVLSGTSVVATGTAVNGVATIPNVKNGTYVIKVEQTGFNANTATVVVNGDTATTVTLELTTEFTATQIGRQKIQITGENLTDTVADYIVKKGSSTVSLANVKVSEDKKVATLTTASSAMAAGDYTVTFNEKEKTQFTAAAETVQQVVILGTDLVVASTYDGNTDKTATIDYKILNQFGERMQGTINATSSLGTATVQTPASTKKDGTIEVNLTTAATLGTTTGSLSLVETASGKYASVVVTVTSKSVINKVSVLGVYDMSGSEPVAAKITTGKNASDYAILLKAYDQYGKNFATINGTSGAANVTVSVAGSTELAITGANWTSNTVKVNDETYIAIPFDAAELSTAGTAVVTIVGNAVGLLATVNVNVKKAVAVADIQISPVDTLYVGTKTEIEYTAVDTEGNTVTDYSTLNKLGTTPFNNNTDFSWERQNDGSAKLYLTPTVNSAGVTLTETPTGKNYKTAVLTSTIGTNVHTTTVNVYAQKTSTAIVGLDSTVAKASIIGGNAVKFEMQDLIIQDQYGNIMSDDEVKKDAGTVYVKAVKEENGTGFDNKYSTVNASSYTRIGSSNALNTSVFSVNTGAEAGTSVYTLSLATANDGTHDIKNSDFQVTLKSASIEKVTDITLKTLPKLHATSNDANVSKNVDLEVTGKYGALTVTVPHTQYTVVLGKDTHITDNNNGTITAKYQDDLKDKDGNPTSVKETIELVIKNSAGTSVKQEVTISSETPTAAKVSNKDNTAFSLSKDGTETIAYTDLQSLITITDQYEGKSVTKADDSATYNSTTEHPRVLFTNVPSDFKVTGNNTTGATLSLTDAKVGTYTVDVALTFDSGVVFKDTLVVYVSATAAEATLSAQNAANFVSTTVAQLKTIGAANAITANETTYQTNLAAKKGSKSSALTVAEVIEVVNKTNIDAAVTALDLGTKLATAGDATLALTINKGVNVTLVPGTVGADKAVKAIDTTANKVTIQNVKTEGTFTIKLTQGAITKKIDVKVVGDASSTITPTVTGNTPYIFS